MPQSASTYAATSDYGQHINRLERDNIPSTSLATGVTLTYDVEVSHTNWIVVQGDLTGAANGDLAVTVQPYEEDNQTLSALTITADAGHTAGPTFGGGVVQYWGRFDVTGIGKVRITWKNNNAGTQTLKNASWRTEDYAGR